MAKSSTIDLESLSVLSNFGTQGIVVAALLFVSSIFSCISSFVNSPCNPGIIVTISIIKRVVALYL